MNRNNTLMGIADRVLNDGKPSLIRKDGTIVDSYNGQVAALGVSFAMNGLCATLATYYKGSNNDTRTVDRRPILEVIARMIHADAGTNRDFLEIVDAETLVRKAVRGNDAFRKTLQKEIIECAVALKQVVRTYNLVAV